MSNDSEVEIEFDRLVRETDSAYLISIGDFEDEKEYWLPKSQVDMGEDETFVMVPEWLALEKGLI